MQFSKSILLALGLVAGSDALPSQERGIIRWVFTFEGAAASYTVDVSPNGKTVLTSMSHFHTMHDLPAFFGFSDVLFR
jgi:hypothetical protein